MKNVWRNLFRPEGKKRVWTGGEDNVDLVIVRAWVKGCQVDCLCRVSEGTVRTKIFKDRFLVQNQEQFLTRWLENNRAMVDAGESPFQWWRGGKRDIHKYWRPCPTLCFPHLIAIVSLGLWPTTVLSAVSTLWPLGFYSCYQLSLPYY